LLPHILPALLNLLPKSQDPEITDLAVCKLIIIIIIITYFTIATLQAQNTTKIQQKYCNMKMRVCTR